MKTGMISDIACYLYFLICFSIPSCAVYISIFEMHAIVTALPMQASGDTAIMADMEVNYCLPKWLNYKMLLVT